MHIFDKNFPLSKKPSDLKEISLNKLFKLLKLNIKKEEKKIIFKKFFSQKKFYLKKFTFKDLNTYLKFYKNINNESLRVSSSKDLNIWDLGWKEIYYKYKKKKILSNLYPQYHRARYIIRLKSKYYFCNKNFEKDFFKIIFFIIINKFCNSRDEFYEFGCGTGVNLIYLNKLFPNSKIYGLDWSIFSQKIIKLFFVKNIIGKKFDIYKPSYKIVLSNKSVVVSCLALEQVGKSYKLFYNYLKKNKPRICIHIEPLHELYKSKNNIRSLENAYHKKRNYLEGYLTFLKKEEKRGNIKIIKSQNLFGGLFIDSYCYVIYKFV